MAARYPVMLDLGSRDCLVVGGGEVATRRVLGLLASDAQVTVLAPVLAAPLAELAELGRIAWTQAAYAGLGRPAAAEAWSLVIAATDDPHVNAQVSADAVAAGTWANEASSPVGGAVAIPAAWRADSVTLAVSTDGLHPAAARWLCDQAAATVTPETLTALRLIDEVRHQDGAGDEVGRRPDWRQAVDSGMLDLIRAGHLAEAKERLQACLSSSSD